MIGSGWPQTGASESVPASSLFIGLMSGTSMDAVDAVLVDLGGAQPQLLATHHQPLPPTLREELIDIASPGDDGIDRVGRLDAQLGELFAASALAVTEAGRRTPERIAAIGSHGQTVRHRPGTTPPFTVQIGDPNIIAERTGITTVADFRRRDVAAGGQGAPLVPAFHAAIFHTPDRDRAILNIGGMANLSVVPAAVEAEVFGFDTGPGNTLMDAWCQRHLGMPFDEGGRWGASGEVDTALLARLLEAPYLRGVPPKSTGREEFNLPWLEERLVGNEAPQDVQATLCAFTAASAADALERFAPATEEVLVCGGGAYNPTLMEALEGRLGNRYLASTSAYGVDPRWVEAIAFAWLAQRTLAGLPGNLPAVTGARHRVILGGIYPGGDPRR